jgi:hypothetical protein
LKDKRTNEEWKRDLNQFYLQETPSQRIKKGLSQIQRMQKKKSSQIQSMQSKVPVKFKA